MKRLHPIDVTEQVPVTFEFIEELAEGEALSTPVVTVTAVRGLDTSPSARLVSAAQVVGSDIVVMFGNNPVRGETYLLECTTQTSNSQKLTTVALLPVRDLADL